MRNLTERFINKIKLKYKQAICRHIYLLKPYRHIFVHNTRTGSLASLKQEQCPKCKKTRNAVVPSVHRSMLPPRSYTERSDF